MRADSRYALRRFGDARGNTAATAEPLAELTDHLDSTVGEIVVVRLLVDGVVVREDILDDKVVERPHVGSKPRAAGQPRLRRGVHV